VTLMDLCEKLVATDRQQSHTSAARDHVDKKSKLRIWELAAKEELDGRGRVVQLLLLQPIRRRRGGDRQTQETAGRRKEKRCAIAGAALATLAHRSGACAHT